MKRIIPYLLAAAMILSCIGTVAAEGETKEWNAQTFAKLYPYAAQVKERVQDAVVLRTDVNCAMVRGERTTVDDNIKVTPEEQDGVIFVPAAFTAESLGAQNVHSETAGTVAFNADGKQVTFKEGETSVNVDGTAQTLAAAPYRKEDVLLVPVQTLADLFGKKVSVTTERKIGGLIILSDEETFFGEGEDDLAYELICQMAYARPSGEQVLADVKAKMGGAHPRIMATAEDFARIRKEVKTDPHMKQWLADLTETADQIVATELGTPPVSSDWSKGNVMRDDIENVAMMYQITGDKKYAECVKAYLLYACNITQWGPAQFLDVVEIATGIAIGYDWIYEYLTPEERQTISSNIVSKALEPGLATYRLDAAGAWPTRDTNWNIVCNGGLMTCALAVADESPSVAAETIEWSMRGVEYMMWQYAPEGGWHEGVTYWDYTDEFMVYFTASLLSASGSEYGMYYNTQGMRNTGYHLFDMTGPVTIFNIHDANEQELEPERMFFHADHMDDNTLARLTLLSKKNTKGDALDLLFYKPAKMKNCESAPLPSLDGSYEAVAITTMRSDWEEPNAVYAALHGGYNLDTHGQIDAGDFVLDAMGKRWVCDPGKESYSLPNYWNYTGNGTGRGSYYTVRAEGNNTIVVNPGVSEGQVMDATAPLVDFESKAQGGYGVIDMTEVLQPYVTSAKRGLMLYDNRSKVLLQDELNLRGEYNVLWFVHTTADITLSADRKTAYLEQDGRRMQVSILNGAPSGAVFRTMEAEPLITSPNPSGQKSLDGMQKLVIAFKAKGEVTLPVVFIPLEDDKQPTLPVVTKMQNWSIPDGALTKQSYPKLDTITIDGEPIANFNADTMSYVVDLDRYDDEGIEVQAQAAAGIQTSIEKIGDGNYRISAKNKRGKVSLYDVRFTFQAWPVPENVERSAVRSVVVSSQPQAENPSQNAIDGDLATRWSAEGTDEWIQLELKQETNVDGIGIAFLEGNSRIAYIDVQISKDAQEWTTIFSGDSSGRTLQEEYFPADGQSVRYVRVRLHGTSIGTWNSITEIGVYQQK